MIHTVYLTAFVIGVTSGLRTFTAPAAVSWAAWLGALRLERSPLAFLAFGLTPCIFTALAVFEFHFDVQPGSGSRKTPWQFAVRLASGALCGAAVAASAGSWAIGLSVGVLGAILGTLAGSSFRDRLAQSFRRDRPAAFVEDTVAIVGALIAVAVLR